MAHKFKSAMLIAPLLLALAGCAPKELFSFVDRNCFVADWTNHYSCLSCCCYGKGCQQCHPVVEGEMLVLGKVGAADSEASDGSVTATTHSEVHAAPVSSRKPSANGSHKRDAEGVAQPADL